MGHTLIGKKGKLYAIRIKWDRAHPGYSQRGSCREERGLSAANLSVADHGDGTLTSFVLIARQALRGLAIVNQKKKRKKVANARDGQ